MSGLSELEKLKKAKEMKPKKVTVKVGEIKRFDKDTIVENKDGNLIF